MIELYDWYGRVPTKEAEIGKVGENEVEERVFLLRDTAYSSWTFRLDIETNQGRTDIVLLDKAITDGGIKLTWVILRQHVVDKGRVRVQIRAENGNREKHSNIMCFTAAPSITASQAPPANPTEIEQAEQRMDALLEQSENAASQAGASALEAARAAQEAKDVKAYTKGESDARYLRASLAEKSIAGAAITLPDADDASVYSLTIYGTTAGSKPATVTATGETTKSLPLTSPLWAVGNTKDVYDIASGTETRRIGERTVIGANLFDWGDADLNAYPAKDGPDLEMVN